MVDPPLLCFRQFNTLARDPICLKTAVVLFLATGESNRTSLLLPFIFPTPGQLSLAAGVAGANGWDVSFKVPFPLFDAGAGVDTGCDVGSATSPFIHKVSFFITGMIVAGTVATLIKREGDAIGAAAVTIGSPTAPFPVPGVKDYTTAGAPSSSTYAGVAALPIPPIACAAIRGLAVVKEEKEEEEALPCCHN